jgi:hypothetical protein
MVFEDRADPKPSYIMWLGWRDGRISFIRNYRYVIADADPTLAPEAKPADDGAPQVHVDSVRDHGRRQGLRWTGAAGSWP